MYSPGYEEENKTKPALVLKIEESDPGLSPEKAAEGLYEGAFLSHSTFFSGDEIERDHMCRCAKRRISHYGYIRLRAVSNEHPRVLAVWVKHSQRPALRSYRYGTFACALVNRCRLHMIRVDWSHAVAERCGQAGVGPQTRAHRIFSIEEYLGARVMSFYMRAVIQGSELVKMTK